MTETLSLRALLRLDALIGLACGLALSLGAAPLGALFGLPPGLLLGAGLALFPCAGLMALAAQRLSRPLVALVVIGNWAWAAAWIISCKPFSTIPPWPSATRSRPWTPTTN